MPYSQIAPKLLAELNRQINQELSAAYGYRALSLWCANQNLQGFTAFFQKQNEEERVHAEKIIAHLTDRRIVPELTAVAAPKQDFKSLLQIAHQAQAMEKANTQGINAVYEAALAAKDYPVQILMQWFVMEQVEEQRWSAEMVERVQAATCAGGLSDLDRHIERFLAGGKKEQA